MSEVLDLLTAREVLVDEAGNPIVTEEETAAEIRDIAKNMVDLWHKNTVSNVAFIKHHQIGSVIDFYIKRTSWKIIFREFIPRYYYAIKNVFRELKSRRLADSREKIIVCGIGDSLLQDCLYLWEAKKSGWKIMAIDRARPQLLSWGLVPDFTVALDGQRHVANYFDNIRKEENIFLCMQVHPSVIQKVHDSGANIRMFEMRAGDNYDNLVKDAIGSEFLVTYGYNIVMPSAIDIALNMGYSTVATIGTELGWKSKEDVEEIYKHTARETANGWWSIKQFEEAAVGFQVIANVVDMSNNVWKNERGFKKRNLIDCSGGIDKGYPYMPIKELLEKEKKGAL